VQAALTGHLVLSTLHTNDAPSSITRLLDLRVPGFLISSTVLGILAQRLVRVICTHCAEEYEPAYEESLALNMPFEQLASRTLRRTLREAVIEKVLNGTTTVSEMVRVAGK
jgi:type IV pilus assembly protein PilB